MSKLIDTDTLANAIQRERDLLIERGQYGAEHILVHHFERIVEDIPAVDAVPVVHAEWVVDGPGLTCSACKGWVDSEIYYMLEPRQDPTYCPYCGAKNVEVET